MTKLSSAQGVTRHTPSFAITTITASLSQGTSARLVEGIGLKGAPSGTSLWVVGAERTRRLHPRNQMIIQLTRTRDLPHIIPLIFTSHFLRCSFLTSPTYLGAMGALEIIVSWRASTMVCLKMLDQLILWKVSLKL